MNQLRLDVPGVNRQVLGIHSGSDMVHTPWQPIAMDRRDCTDENPIELPHEFNCSHLVHFTENDFAVNIGLSDPDHFTFRPSLLPNNFSDSFRLSWWSPLPPNDWRAVIENNLPDVDTEHFDIGNSPAFNGDSLCGPVGIRVAWHDILTDYARSRNGTLADVDFRVLGTFLYTREIMFGILVCMKSDVVVRHHFPLVTTDGTEAFVPGPSQQNFIWKVYSTVGYDGARPTGIFWTWDHISFGFYCPNTNLNIRNRFCRFVTKKATGYRPMSRAVATRRFPAEQWGDENMVDALVRKVLRAN